MTRSDREDLAEARGRNLIELLSESLPIVAKDLSPESAWRITGPGLLARQAGTLESIFALRPLEREADAFILLRSLYEHTVTFAWLAAKPDAERHRRFLKSDTASRIEVDDDCRKVGVEVFTEEERRAFEIQKSELPKQMPDLFQRAEKADTFWKGNLPGLDGSNSANSFRGLYAIAYRRQSSIAHPTLWGLNSVIKYEEHGARRIDFEKRREDSHGPFTLGTLLFTFSLYAASQTLGFPASRDIEALFEG